MEIFLKKSIVTYKSFTNFFIKTKVFELIRRSSFSSQHNKMYASDSVFKIPIGSNLNCGLSIKSVFSICSLILICLSFNPLTSEAASTVKTFKGLDSKYYREHKSDIYDVFVKPIYRKQEFNELDGVPDINDIFDPKDHGFKNSFTYKSVNDIASNDTDAHSKCYQYHYHHPGSAYFNKGQRLETGESIMIEKPNSLNSYCVVPPKKHTNFEKAYEMMTHSNNWTSFDVGDDSKDGSTLRAVRIYIQLNSDKPSVLENKIKNGMNLIEPDIRPKHVVVTDEDEDNDKPNHLLGTDNKYIKVHKYGSEYIQQGNDPVLKHVLVLDVLQPQGTKWSGQFNVSFNNSTISRYFKHPYHDNLNFVGEDLDKHPLFIFVNPLPKWYYNLTNKSNYDGCPKEETNHGLPNEFYTPEHWIPGGVYNTTTTLDNDGIISNATNTDSVRRVNDLLLKSYNKQLCIPGGVYLKGRIVHNHEFHHDNADYLIKKGYIAEKDENSEDLEETTQEYGGLKKIIKPYDLSPGRDNDSNNATGVKIVGRGILSGIDIKYRRRYNETEDNITYVGADWNGHLIDIRHDNSAKLPFGTKTVEDELGNEIDCYHRNADMPGQNVNCVQGITMVDSPKANIYTRGSRIDVENVKMMAWHIETDGIGNGPGNKIKNVFLKVNDDAIGMGKSDINVDNATVWRQHWGSVIKLSWKLKHEIHGSQLNGLNVIRFDQSKNINNNGNGAIVSSRNIRGGTISDFEFNNIIVEDPPYQIINLQLNDTRTYYYADQSSEKNLADGTGIIENITFNGLFTPEPYLVSVNDKSPPSVIQKSIFGIYDGNHPGNSSENICPNNQPLIDDDCVCGHNYKLEVNFNETNEKIKQCVLIERSISGIQFNDVCIDNNGIDTDTEINNYFEFRRGENKSPHYEKDDPYMGDPIPGILGFNGIRNEMGSMNKTSLLCGTLKELGKCTLENYRNICQASH